MKKLWSLVLISLLAVASMDADAARRLGGGGSFGRQSGNVTQRQATPPATPGNTQNATNNAARPTPAPATPAAAPARRPWGAMLGGLAAGLGLAWLANSLGLGGAFANILMFALLAMVVVAVIGYFMRRRGAASQPASPYAFQGAGGGAESARTAPQYSPDKVGNDASARPWERNTMAFDSNKAGSGGTGVQIGSELAGSQNWGVPAGFDTEGFLSAAKRNFVTLQDAWDRSDISSLRSMMTDEMLGEIRAQLAQREGHPGGEPNKTEVVMLEAQLLGIEDLGDDYMASVEFSGMIREEPSAGPSPFREVWNMTKPKSGNSGWLVAGVQALQ
ncbi:MAG: import inner rane translocase subunit Tim44 [Ramlibacter sp.]|jgi:predicted lipid-binding transport protein (Tim44 family)|nr:import inner rane translocase subunit Tim44 [Ramlibacter sp.]